MTIADTFDRSLRAMPGSILLAFPVIPAIEHVFARRSTWMRALSAIGATIPPTAISRFRPTYTVLGTRSCSIK